jgi:CHAT domain-containing protein
MRSPLMLVLVCALAASGTAHSQTPASPTKRTAEQQAKLAERDRLRDEARKFSADGDVAKALPLFEKALALDFDIFGQAHAANVEFTASLAALHERVENYDEALRWRNREIGQRARLLGDDHWTTADARRARDAIARLRKATVAQKRILGSARKAAESHQRAGRFAAAVAETEKGLAVERLLYGDESKQVLGSRRLLAHLHESDGAYVPAGEERREIIAILTRIRGDKHWQTQDARRELDLTNRIDAMTREQRKDWADALAAETRSSTLFAEGRYAEAVRAQRECLFAAQKLLGDRDAVTAARSSVLGLRHTRVEEFGIAAKYVEDAVQIQEKILGVDHPEFAETVMRLAAIESARGRLLAAKFLRERALEIQKRVFGEMSAQHAATLNDFAVSLPTSADLRQQLLQRSIEICEETGDHSQLDVFLFNLSVTLGKRRSFDEAEQAARRALALRESRYATDHPHIALALEQLITLADERARETLDAGDVASARKFHEQQRDWTIRRYGEKDYRTVRSRADFADLDRTVSLTPEIRIEVKEAAAKAARVRDLRIQGKTAAAFELAQESYGTLKKHLGEDDRRTIGSREWLGVLLAQTKNYAESEAHLRGALTARLRLQGPDDPQVANSRTLLTALLRTRVEESVARKDIAAAVVDLEQIQAVAIAQYGEAHWKSVDARLDVEHHNRLGKLDDKEREALAKADKRQAEALVAHSRGNNLLARDAALEAARLYEEALGDSDPQVATALIQHGFLAAEANDPTAGEESLRKALPLCTCEFGEEHPRTSMCLIRLGGVLLQKGDLDAAEKMLIDAYHRIADTDPKSRDLEIIRTSLGGLYEMRGDLGRRELCHLKNVELRRAHAGGGENSMNLAISLTALSEVYRARKEYDRADAGYREALEIRRKNAPNSPAVAGSLHDLAVLANDQQKLDEAIRNQGEAVGILEKAVTYKDHRTKAGAEWLAARHEERANRRLLAEAFAGAKEDAVRVVELKLACFGPGDWRVSDARINQRRIESRAALSPDQRLVVLESEKNIVDSDILANKGETAKAIEILNRARSRTGKILGADDPLFGTLGNRLGLRYMELRDYAKANAMFRLDLDLRARQHGKNHPQYALCLAVLAAVPFAQEEFGEAERLYREALELRKATRGPNHFETHDSLDRLAVLHETWARSRWVAREYGLAIENYRQAYECKKQRFGETDWRTIDARVLISAAKGVADLNDDARKSLDEAGGWFAQGMKAYGKGKYADAASAHRKCEAVRVRILGEEHPLTVESRFQIGRACRDADAKEAERLFAHVLRWRMRELGDFHPETADVCQELGRLHASHVVDYPAAEQEFERARNIFLKTFGAQSKPYAQVLKNQARLANFRLDFPRAERIGKLAFEATRSAFGEESEDHIGATAILGESYRGLGDYSRSEPLLRNAIDGYRRLLGDKHPLVAIVLSMLGDLYSDTGDTSRAANSYREALAIYREANGADHPMTAKAIMALGRVSLRRRDLVDAEKQFCEAQRIFEVGSPGNIDCLHYRSAVHVLRKEYDKAETLAAESLEARNKLYGPQSLAAARSLTLQAKIREARDDCDGALDLLRQVLAIRKRTLGKDHPLCAKTLRDLGRIQRKAGQTDAAGDSLSDALRIMHAIAIAAANGQSERQQLVMAGSLRGFVDDYLSYAIAARAPGGDVYRPILAWKGSVFARQLHAHEIRAAQEAADPKVLKLYQQLDEAATQLAQIEHARLNDKDTAAAAAANAKIAEGLIKKLERHEAELAALSSDFRTRKAREALTAAQLQAALPADAVLIDYLEYAYSGPALDGSRGWVTENRLLAFVIRGDRAIRLHDLGPAAPIADLVDDWRKTVKRRVPVMKKNDPAVELRNRIWAPLESDLADAKAILISPDGALTRLPFAALPGKKAGAYLLEEQSIAVIPVPQLMPEMLATPKTDPTAKEAPSLLVLGNVDYGSAPGEAEGAVENRAAGRIGSVHRYGALPGSEAEIAMVKKYFERRFPNGRAETLEEADATERQFRLHAPRNEWLHLATHGFFAPVKSSPTGTAWQDDESSAAIHPGLLSGLAMAGANAPIDPKNDDGILTALEVAQLDLHRVQLAVLSACETGLGKEAAGEGVLGLQRSFQVAGARSVVASLWSVDDSATSRLMQRFYENLWKKNMSRHEALRDSQIWMLRQGGQRAAIRDDAEPSEPGRAPPYLWAAFVLSGDWR